MIMDLPIFDEAELKAATTLMYTHGGVDNVLKCVLTMQKCERVILEKLSEILDQEMKK